MRRHLIGLGLTATLFGLLLFPGGPGMPAALAVPANDNFAGAINLTPTATTAEIAATNTAGATLEASEPVPCATGGAAATVWYNWTSPASTGVATFTTLGSNYDTVLAIYTGNSVSALTPVACNDGFTVSQSAVSFSFAASTTYRIQVGGGLGAQGDLILNLSRAGVFVVNTASDNNVRDDFLSLREALAVAAAVVISGTACDPLTAAEKAQILNCAGIGLGAADLIQFSPNLFLPAGPTTIPLNSTLLLPGPDVVDGAGAGVLVRPAGAVGSLDCFNVILGGAVIRKIQVASCNRGILLSGTSAFNKIGPGNQIYGNQTGIYLDGANVQSNQILGNTIGKSGAANTVGIFALNARQNTIGGQLGVSGNAISHNAVGIQFDGTNTTLNQITGNYIGTDATGTQDNGNSFGIQFTGNTNNNVIGGTSPELRNVISGNNQGGIRLSQTANRNRIEGNFIGTNAAGTAAIAQADAIEVFNNASSNVIGGPTAAHRNVISGNQTAIEMDSFGGANAVYEASPFVAIPPGSQASTTITVPETAYMMDVNVTINVTHPDVQDLTIFITTPDNTSVTLAQNNGGSGDNFTNTTFDDEAATHIGSGTAPFTGSFRPINPLSVKDGDRSAGNWGLVVNNNGPDAGTINSWSLRLNTRGNEVNGNYIGTNQAGTAAIPNVAGISIIGDNNQLGGLDADDGNVIGGSTGGPGIRIEGGVDNWIQKNRIGVNAAGTAALANSAWGLSLVSSTANLVENNTISGNASGGVELFSSDRNVFSLNHIGVNTAGTAKVANGGPGVLMYGASDENEFYSNVVSGNNGSGFEIVAGDSNDLSILKGNKIGTLADGVTAAGNGFHGISSGGLDTLIGGTSFGNTIAYNAADGVAVHGTRTRLEQNSIHSNGGLGIDLGDNGVTANDAGDGDNGPNQLQNYPELFFATVGGGNTMISTGLSSSPGENFVIEYFHTTACDASGHGEGQVFIGSVSVSTGPGGTVSFGPTFPGEVPAGRFITATATRGLTLETSEFSNCIPAVDDTDDDNDGFTDSSEGGTPLCIGTATNTPGTRNEDSFDDALVNDGCPAVSAPEADCADTTTVGLPLDDDGDGAVNDGCPQAGSFSEAQFKIGTGAFDPCGNDGWPLDLVSSTFSANKVDIQDLGSFVVFGARKMNTNPGDPNFNSRWDLVPGPIVGAEAQGWINIQDLGATVSGPTGFPPMLGGAKAMNGPPCPFPP